MKLIAFIVIALSSRSEAFLAPTQKPGYESRTRRLLSRRPNRNERSVDVRVHETSFILKPDNATNILYQDRKFYRPWRRRAHYPNESHISFPYKYNELVIPSTGGVDDKKTRITLLIQPIGVGIGRWYYDRLLAEFQSFRYKESDGRNIFLAPDLLGCGSACHADLISSEGSYSLQQLPLLNVNNWSDQLIDLMSKYENDLGTSEVEWCVVSNGGCVPIALEIAKQYVDNPILLQGTLTNLILSATPSATGLMRPQDVEKVQKAYKTLSGVSGKLFWWYALRNEGAFIQKFSEKNLASRAENLGSEWTPKCVETARAFGGRSRFSTFAFLAGSLNGGNEDRFKALKGRNELQIDVITGRDTRSNPAKSWFWERRRDNKTTVLAEEVVEKTSLVQLLKENGNSGREGFVKGRRCPAHEDAKGFSNKVMQLLRG